MKGKVPMRGAIRCLFPLDLIDYRSEGRASSTASGARIDGTPGGNPGDFG